MSVRWTDDGRRYPEPPDGREYGEGAAPVRFFLADLAASFDAATKTAAVIGLVLALYVAGHALGELTHWLGALMYAAANGAMQ